MEHLDTRSFPDALEIPQGESRVNTVLVSGYLRGWSPDPPDIEPVPFDLTAAVEFICSASDGH